MMGLFRSGLVITLWILQLPLLGSQLTSADTTLFVEGIRLINRQMNEIALLTDDSKKTQVNEKIKQQLSQLLSLPGSFEYPFDSLRHIGVVYPPDSTFRIFTWNLSFRDGTYRHYGILQRKEGLPVTLTDRAPAIVHPTDTVTGPETWYGALYYRILKNKWKNRTYYTLLGLSLHNSLTNRKVIDVLTFDRKGRIRFGAPLFDLDGKTLYRIIFEFNAHISMLLHYDDRMGMIVYDHLSPARPELKGLPQYYGPDSSYDGFFFYKGKWRLREDLDVRNEE